MDFFGAFASGLLGIVEFELSKKNFVFIIFESQIADFEFAERDVDIVENEGPLRVFGR